MNYSGLMDTRKFLCFFLITTLLTTISNCACEEDEFGEILHLEIPVDVGADRNSFVVGDTLWVKADFSKEVKVLGNTNRIDLVDYKFFSSLYIDEISETQLRSYFSPDVVVEEGVVEANQLGGYDYTFDFTGSRYRINFGIVLSQPGIFSLISITDGDAQSELNQAAHYTCGDNRRTNVFIDRFNRFSTIENFNDFVEWNRVEANGFVYTFEEYIPIGKYTFRVVE